MVGNFPIVPDIKTYEIDLDERYIYQPIDNICQSPTGNVFSADCFYGYLFPTGKGLRTITFVYLAGRKN